MTNARHWLHSLLMGLSFYLALSTPLSAYEVLTHRAISEAAIRQSTAQTALDSLLAVVAIDDETNRKTLVEWVRQGTGLEDDQPRFVNHFHNPLAKWTEAGLRRRYFSSIRWGQVATNEWSWSRVRDHLYDAVTKDTRNNRDTALAKVFRGLGHQMHLVQDAASPPHTREDIHMLGYHYEKFVVDIQQREPDFLLQHLQFPIGPDPSWRSLQPNTTAPLVVARLIDTDLYASTDEYTGVNPAITGTALTGLAEYTNANFLSEDTLWTSSFSYFTYPKRSSAAEVEREVRLPSGELVRRRYYQKVADGDTGHLLATVGFLRNYFVTYHLDPTRAHHTAALDEMVYREYARQLVPRAVGYSTALVDHFFGGSIRARIRFQTYVIPEIGIPARDRIAIQNASSNGVLEGTFAFYSEEENGTRRRLVEWPLTIPAGGSSEGLVVPLLPYDSLRRTACLIVFRGTLGTEADVIATSLDWGPCLHADPPPPPPTGCPPFCDD